MCIISSNSIWSKAYVVEKWLMETLGTSNVRKVFPGEEPSGDSYMVPLGGNSTNAWRLSRTVRLSNASVSLG